MTILARVLPKTPLAADQDGYPGILGYEGPTLSEVTGSAVQTLAALHRGPDADQVARRGRADPPERALVRARPPAPPAVLRGRRDRGRGESPCGAGNHARDAARSSARTTRASSARRTARPPATAARSAAAPPGPTRSRTTSPSSPATCSSRRQPRRSGATTPSSSAEWSSASRSEEQRELHRHTVEAQQAAFDAFETAKTCADVDSAVLAYLDDNGIRDLWRQHTGHGIGLRNHEAPFLDVGDNTPARARDGLHDRAGCLQRGTWWLSPLGYSSRDRDGNRDPHRLPARPRESDHFGLVRFQALLRKSGPIWNTERAFGVEESRPRKGVELPPEH